MGPALCSLLRNSPGSINELQKAIASTFPLPFGYDTKRPLPWEERTTKGIYFVRTHREHAPATYTTLVLSTEALIDAQRQGIPHVEYPEAVILAIPSHGEDEARQVHAKALTYFNYRGY